MQAQFSRIRAFLHFSLFAFIIVLAGVPASAQTAKPHSASRPAAKPARPAATPDMGLIGAPAVPNAPPAAEPDKGAPAAPPRGFVWLKGDEIFIGDEAGKGQSDYLEVFAFDEKARKAGPVSGMVIHPEGTPVPLVMYGLSASLSSTGGSMCGRYGNLILDFSSTQGGLAILYLGAEESTENGAELARIVLLIGSTKELFISPDYTVFPEQMRTVQKDGPFVMVGFKTGKADAAGAVTPGSTLILSRNNAQVTQKKLDASGVYPILLKRVSTSNDVLAWRVEDAAGKITHQGTLGFPVRGATQGNVIYSVEIDDHPVNAAAK